MIEFNDYETSHDNSKKELFQYRLLLDDSYSYLFEKITTVFGLHQFKVKTNSSKKRTHPSANQFVFEHEQKLHPTDFIDRFEKVTNDILEILNPHEENRQLFLEKLQQHIINKYPNIKKDERRSEQYSSLSFSFVKFIDYATIYFRIYELEIKANTPSELLLQIIKIFEDQQFKTEIKEERRDKTTLRFYFYQKTDFTELVNIFEKVTDEVFKIAL